MSYQRVSIGPLFSIHHFRLILTYVMIACFVLVVLLSIHGSITPSFAFIAPHPIQQIQQLVVNTDKQSYSNDDTITVSGQVGSPDPKNPITIRITNSFNNLVRVEQITISRDGSFSIPILAKGPLWIYDGQYTVKVQYGFSDIVATATFNFQNQTLPDKGTIQVKDPKSNQIYDVNYTITYGKVKEITATPENLALNITINSTKNGTLMLKVPRLLIDAKRTDGSDESFLVFIDKNQLREFDDKPDADFRTITLSFFHDESQIELIGTQIVPEFSQIVTPIVIISMTSGIVISRLGQKAYLKGDDEVVKKIPSSDNLL
ncbi:MAG: hypothetical protein ACREBB_08515 [Nitrosotalea sp.]